MQRELQARASLGEGDENRVVGLPEPLPSTCRKLAAILKEKCKVADVPGYVRMITAEREEDSADSDDDAADSDNDFGLDNDVGVEDTE